MYLSSSSSSSSSSLILFWLCLALSASALSTHSHRAIAHRGLVRRANTPLAPVRKRADGKRCRQRTSTSTLIHSTPVANVAPQPTTSHAPPPPSPTKDDGPKTTHPPPPPPPKDDKPTTHQPAPTTKPAPPPPPPAPPKPNTGGFMSGTQTGQGTFYSTGLGACGVVNHDTDYIAAASHLLFDQFPGYNGVNPNNNPLCNKKVRATYKGKSIVVAITDRCEGCALTDLDFSPSAFKDLADFSVGRISGMTWVWI